MRHRGILTENENVVDTGATPNQQIETNEKCKKGRDQKNGVNIQQASPPWYCGPRTILVTLKNLSSRIKEDRRRTAKDTINEGREGKTKSHSCTKCAKMVCLLRVCCA